MVARAQIARAQIARARTTINSFARPAQLVTSSLFRVSRNPMYVGLSMMVIGFGLACGAVSSLLLAVLFVAITDGWYIAFEERMLKRTFGSAFDEYARSTRRWL